MAQDDSRQNDRSFPRLRPKEDGPNGPRKGPKFNIYWIWAIIFAVLIGFQFFGSLTPDAKPLESELEFRTHMLATGDVSKLVLVTNKNLVRVYIKKESLEKPYYKEKLSKSWPGMKPEGPHFEFRVAKADEWENRMEQDFQKNPALAVPITITQEGEWLPGVLNFL